MLHNYSTQFINLNLNITIGNKEYKIVGVSKIKDYKTVLVSKDVFDKYHNLDYRYSAIVYLGDNYDTIKGKMENSGYFGPYLEFWPIRREFLSFDNYAKEISYPSNINKLILILALIFIFNIFLYVNLSYKKSKNDIKILLENKESITKISLMKTFVFFVSLVPFFILIVPILLILNEIINPIICNRRNQLKGYNSRIVFRLFNFNYMTVIWCFIALLIIMVLFFIISYYKIWRMKKYD